jgi:hypothetical protein
MVLAGPPYRWHFDARAVGTVRAIAMDGECLRAKCEKKHDLGYQLLGRTVDIVGQRLEATRFRLLDLYSANVQPEPKRAFDHEVPIRAAADSVSEPIYRQREQF